MISQALRKHQTSIIFHLNDYAYHQKTTSENGSSDSYFNETQTELFIKQLSHTTSAKESFDEFFDTTLIKIEQTLTSCH